MAAKKNTRWIWIGLIVVLTSLIFMQSVMNGVDSSRESSAVQALLQQVFGAGVMDTFLYRFIRKVAHFTEYAVLGGVWGGYDRMCNPPRWQMPLAGVLTAMADECLQFFSPGRSPQLTDVLLDCAGYCCGAGLVCICLWLHRRRRSRRADETR